MQLIEFTDKGLYCRQGNFYIDPWKPVVKALITHAHSDHARWGSQQYLAHKDSKPILQLRLGDIKINETNWNEPIFMNGVKVSFHPAGHVIGSAQIRVEYKGEVWVVSGDYKTQNDGISRAFEPVKCHTFITESTFGLPIYKWKSPQQLNEDIQQWIIKNIQQNKTSVLIAYSLGKAQRVIEAAGKITNKIFAHGAVYNVQQAFINAGFALQPVNRITADVPKSAYEQSVIVAPPSADGTPWMKKFSPSFTGVCSGWMQVRGNARRRNADAGFVMSDHADWPGLISAIKETGAEKVYVTHGFQAAFSRYLNGIGIMSEEVITQFGNEEEELTDPIYNDINNIDHETPNVII